MKNQILFSRKNKKNISNLLSAESAHSVPSVNMRLTGILFTFRNKIQFTISSTKK